MAKAFSLELWRSWLSRLPYTQKVLGSNPSSSIFLLVFIKALILMIRFQIINLQQ
jgi:hypothetical protein